MAYGSKEYIEDSEEEQERLALEAELVLLQAMTNGERRVMLAEVDVTQAVAEMNQEIFHYRFIGHEIDVIKSLAREAVLVYTETNQDDSLADVEMYADILKDFVWYRGHVREQIKQKRERVRWLRKRLKELKS